MKGRTFSDGSRYRYGFNGKENDNETVSTGQGTQDYGMRIYNPSLGRFLSVDPLTEGYPWLTPYQFAANNPIKYIDLDGAEATDPTTALFYSTSPKIDMTNAPAGSATNAAGFPRNGPWYWRQALKSNPEMFSADNIARIKLNQSPHIDAQWLQHNPSHAGYTGKLIHHHINQGSIAAAIPEKVHQNFFSKLHPALKGASFKGLSIKGLGGGLLSIGIAYGDIAGAANGNPDSWWTLFPCIGCDPSDYVGKVQKDWETGYYMTINSVKNTYDANGNLTKKVLQYDIYENFIYDEENKKYIGVDKVDSATETWTYDKDGKRSESVHYKSDEG